MRREPGADSNLRCSCKYGRCKRRRIDEGGIDAANNIVARTEIQILKAILDGSCKVEKCDPDQYVQKDLTPLAARRLVLFIDAMNKEIIPNKTYSAPRVPTS